jgi:hypothetical protein
MTLADALWHLIDCVFPQLRPLSKQAIQREIDIAAQTREYCEQCLQAVPGSEEGAVLSRYLAECAEMLENEDSRRQGVEARLTSILGLFAIAGTIVFSSIVAQAVGTLRAPTSLLRWTLALGAFYLALQICCALRAAVSGLGRRGYDAPTARNIFIASGESPIVHTREQIANSLKILANHQQRNNEKVSQMAVAHCAMRNFIVALVLFAAIGTVAAVGTKPPEDALIQSVKKNHELNEMLRGPQGPKGDPGPVGPKGDPASSIAPASAPNKKTTR